MASQDSNRRDLQDVSLFFHNYGICENVTNASDCCVYVGEVLRYDVVINKPADVDYRSWKSRISQLSAHACVAPMENPSGGSAAPASGEKHDGGDTEKEKNVAVNCSVITTYMDTVDKKNVSGGGSFQREQLVFKNHKSCIVPMSTCVMNAPGQCQQAELRVTLWLSASPLKGSQDTEMKRDFQLNSAPSSSSSSSSASAAAAAAASARGKCVEQISVSKQLRVRDPPHLKARFLSCGQQHLLLVQVSNATRQTIIVKNMTIVPRSSPPSCDHREFLTGSFSRQDSRGGSDSWQQLVSLALSGGTVFPTILAGCEEMALIYRLDLSSVSSQVELAFHSYLRWTHPGTNKEINTIFGLPKLQVRYPAFTVSVKCEGPVETGKTFYLTYNIANNLQDFLSVRLYWNLDSQLALLRDKPEREQEKRKLGAVKRAIICHDPDIFIGELGSIRDSVVKLLCVTKRSCPRGCMLPVSVGFQILQPGLYEFGELMKLNLRWALPDSQSTLKQDSVGTPVSSDTLSTLSGDDQLLASTALWRHRSGSTCSLQTPPTSIDQSSAEERRRTFATKSYSFGDLGPTLSADSDDTSRMRFKSIKRSTAVMPPRPPPPGNLGQPEKELADRNNFLKKSFKIYIPGSCV